MNIKDVTDEDVEASGEAVGMMHGAWDMVDPKELIEAAWKLKAGKGCKEPPTSDARYRQLREMILTVGRWARFTPLSIESLKIQYPDLTAGREGE